MPPIEDAVEDIVAAVEVSTEAGESHLPTEEPVGESVEAGIIDTSAEDVDETDADVSEAVSEEDVEQSDKSEDEEAATDEQSESEDTSVAAVAVTGKDEEVEPADPFEKVVFIGNRKYGRAYGGQPCRGCLQSLFI